LINQNDDGGANVPADAVTGSHYHTVLQSGTRKLRDDAGRPRAARIYRPAPEGSSLIDSGALLKPRCGGFFFAVAALQPDVAGSSENARM
jgi:hypothetical protein